MPDYRNRHRETDSEIEKLIDRPIGEVSPPVQGQAILLLWEKCSRQEESAPDQFMTYWMAVFFDESKQCWRRMGLIRASISPYQYSDAIQEDLAAAVKKEFEELAREDCLQNFRIG